MQVTGLKIVKVNIIGNGNVGWHFSQILGDSVHGVYNRTNLSDLRPDVDLNIIAVTDSSISEVAAKLPKEIPVAHTSGAMGLDLLSAFKGSGILYPLQTFTKGVAVDMKTVPVLIEANSPEFCKYLEDFCRLRLSPQVIRTNSKERADIHLAAVFACNFTTLMLAEAEKILGMGIAADTTLIKFNLLRPLVEETLRKAFTNGPANSLTGPAVRGDKEVMDSHLQKITDEKLREMYRLLSARIQSLKQ